MTLFYRAAAPRQAAAPTRAPLPTREQPGTLGQQLEALGLYGAMPWRHLDRDAAWHLARRLAIPHARRATK